MGRETDHAVSAPVLWCSRRWPQVVQGISGSAGSSSAPPRWRACWPRSGPRSPGGGPRSPTPAPGSTVDVATSWVEPQAVWGKGQLRVGTAIPHVRQRLPMRLRGLDSDNGSEFINHDLYAWCQREGVTFTRSRPYQKNDSAHVEQKNGAIVRPLIGYDRYASRAAYAQLTRAYELARLHINFFQPVQKLVTKERRGPRVHRVYDRAQTPYQRLGATGVLSAPRRQELEVLYQRLNPLHLRRALETALERLWPLAVPPPPSPPPPRENAPERE
jgi:hypothetical protein